MRTNTFKRAARVAAITTVPVAVAFLVSTGPATAADAGELEVTTTIEYDYVILEGDGVTAGVAGTIPVTPGVTDTNLYANYTGDNYLVGYNYNVESGVSSLTGEIYPSENLTLGATTDSTGYSTVYADYATDQFAVGGSIDSDGYGSVYGEIYPAEGVTLGITADNEGAASVYGSYATDDYSVGFNSDLGGDTTVYAETYPDENTTIGVDANLTTGESNAYGSTSVPLGEDATLTTDWEYGLTDPAPVAP